MRRALRFCIWFAVPAAAAFSAKDSCVGCHGLLAALRLNPAGAGSLYFEAMPRPTLCLSLVLAALLLATAACKRSQPRADATIEEGPVLQTMLQMGDPNAAPQLIRGFYEVEAGAWRWTMGKFAVTLSPPPQAATHGARLTVMLVVPEPVIRKLGAVTLSAGVDGVALPGETYAKAGQYVYSREVPAQSLAKRAVTVDFALDKFLPPGEADQRELGLVVTAAGFEPK